MMALNLAKMCGRPERRPSVVSAGLWDVACILHRLGYDDAAAASIMDDIQRFGSAWCAVGLADEHLVLVEAAVPGVALRDWPDWTDLAVEIPASSAL